MKMQIAAWMLLGLVTLTRPVSSPAGCCDAPTQTYRMVYETVYDERAVTAYRMEYDTVYEEQQVTVNRPVYETQVRERRYTVAKPVIETSEREERYTVLKPVYETQMRDASYDRVREVCETAEREERYQVSRPVWETSEREERYVVRRPVVETAEREESYTVMEPVTTYRPVQVDRGGYVCQQVLRPGPTITRLRWHSAHCGVDPATGQTVYQRGGLYWTPFTAPAQVEARRVWQPNIVEEQVPQTSYVARVETRRVPVQVQKFVDEEMVRRVPQQTCRMVMEEHVRRVPYTVRRQVVERVEQQVPVQVCRYERQEMVRKIPVSVQRMTYEERVEQTPVQVCRYEPTIETRRVPRTVARKVPVTYTCRVPRLVAQQVPVEDCTSIFGCMSGSDALPVESSASPNTTYYYPSSQPTIITDSAPAGQMIRRSEPTPAAKPSTENSRPALNNGQESQVGPEDEDADQPRSKSTYKSDDSSTRPLRRLPRL